MNYPKAESFNPDTVAQKIMGPNPLLLTEELFEVAKRTLSQNSNAADETPFCGEVLPPQSVVLDLGSGAGITSVMLAREYGLITYAADLWSDPTDNMRFFESEGLSNRQIIPLKADAQEGLPFAQGFFDAVVSIDSYNYFGRETRFLDEKLLPYVKSGGLVLIALPGMVKDCHENLPACLLASWNAEQLEYMHDIAWWSAIFKQAQNAKLLDIRPLECTERAWNDWLSCDNEYARGDRASIEAGALEYLNTIAVVLRRK